MTWESIIAEFLKSEQGIELKRKVAESRSKTKVYPAPNKIFEAYLLTPLDKTSIVILGTEPYSNGDISDGLAFSTKKSNTPTELQDIFKELKRDLYHQLNEAQWRRFFPKNDLSSWSKKGILLMNKYLTVEEGRPKSHKTIGWKMFTEIALKTLNEQEKPIVFMFWGDEAVELSGWITNSIHLKLTGSYPGSSDFYGCGHFGQAINFIKANRPDISKSITLNINPYFKKDMFNDFASVIKNDAYPYLFKNDEELADGLRNSLKLTYEYGIDFTLNQ